MNRLVLSLLLCCASALGALGSCAPSDSMGNGGSGGKSPSGSGSGGRVSGGGGQVNNGTGGAAASGGSGEDSGSGGVNGSGGGEPGSATGGGNGSGGATGSGGAAASSGAGSGGRGNGGTGVGGNGSGGMATSTGGAAPTACNLPNHSGSGSFTFYYFGQGTFKESGGYRTACGYFGTGSGTTDTVQNIAKMTPASATYFAAIPGTSGFNTSAKCGACVQITGQNGKVIIATIADECPYGSDGGNQPCSRNPGGHLDLSKAAFDQLGYSVGNPNNTNWKYVPCPVTGNVVIRVKQGNPNELFVENTILNVTAVKGATRTSYGAWHFNTDLTAGQSLELTDGGGRTLTVELKSTTQNQNQDTGKQFPACL